ncbi:MAG: Slp family lipoprotein [Thermodesulforhabdaceae bacterium]|jgi:outer membrane lipoprotein
MKRTKWLEGIKFIWAMVTLLALAACAPSIFNQYAAQIKEPVSLTQAKMNPSRYKGEMVIWGGKIVRVSNRQDGTYFEILQFPLSYDARPKVGDQSEGRFVALYPGFLDPAIYREERLVTVAGRIQGLEMITIGETKHSVPMIRAEKVHLWEDERIVYSPWYESCNDVVCFHTSYWFRWHRHCCW